MEEERSWYPTLLAQKEVTRNPKDRGFILAPWETEGLSWADQPDMPGSVVCSNGIPRAVLPVDTPPPSGGGTGAEGGRDTPSPYLPRRAARAGSAPRP